MSEKTETHQEVYAAWLKAADEVGLTFEVAMDVLHAYFNKHPEDCLEAMNHSMMDWDF